MPSHINLELPRVSLPPTFSGIQSYFVSEPEAKMNFRSSTLILCYLADQKFTLHKICNNFDMQIISAQRKGEGREGGKGGRRERKGGGERAEKKAPG